MGSADSAKLHALFLPLFTPSHIIPTVNVARLFAAQGVKVSIISTKYNTAIFQSSIGHAIESGQEIYVHNLKFPSAEVGLPEGIENFSAAATSPEMLTKVHMAVSQLKEAMEQVIRDLSPHCIISDFAYNWTLDLAENLKIPRIVFHESNCMSHCLVHNLELYEPHKMAKSDSESFLIPGLPDRIEMKRSQLEHHLKGETVYGDMIKVSKDSECRSFGTVLDTCYDFEPQYADYYREILGTKVWTPGPLFYSTKNINTAEKDDIWSGLNWLDSQEPNKVLYISFGSLAKLSNAQLHEIALALESSNQPFIWVVRKNEDEQESWLPDGFEERITKENRGLIVRGWAPQVKILNHPAVGGFMTHCGWNSTMEAMSAAVPLISWALFAEQFYNDKYIELMKVGVSVGATHWSLYSMKIEGPLIPSKQIEDAIKRLMRDSEESREIRNRAKEMAALAKRAVEKGGSSYESLLSMIRDLKSCAFGIKT